MGTGASAQMDGAVGIVRKVRKSYHAKLLLILLYTECINRMEGVIFLRPFLASHTSFLRAEFRFVFVLNKTLTLY